MTDPNIVTPVALQHTNEATCTLPWYVQNSEYPPALATYQPLINGEEAFKAVHLAIEKATKTVDIICWGFQPSMYFIRDGKNEVCIGDLLKEKARKGVRVRVLGWEMPFNLAGFAGEANLPGKGNVRFKDRELQHSTPNNTPLTGNGLQNVPSPTTRPYCRPHITCRCLSAGGSVGLKGPRLPSR